MTNSAQHQSLTDNVSFRPATAALALAIVFALAAVVAQSAQAQTFAVIHSFTGGPDGATPQGRLTADFAGNLYGTGAGGGTGGYGTVFKMAHRGSGWTILPLFSFSGDNNGGEPTNGVVFGPDHSLYGTSLYTVFNLTPYPTRPLTILSPWKINTLYEFQGDGSDGEIPSGDLAFDASGNIYGTTTLGGQDCYEGCGLVYELSPSNGGWAETIPFKFNGSGTGGDGQMPFGLIFDSAGNLYGTAEEGGSSGSGVIFQLSPSSNGWTENILYNFDYHGNGGYLPQAGLISDASGNFYGSTSDGPGGSGVIFELSPSNGGWTYTVLAQIPSKYEGGPAAPLTLDAAGSLYGTVNGYCEECPGCIFKLTPGSSGWTFTSLHDFTGGKDGGHPYSTVVIDATGNLYGTASVGGIGPCGTGCGVVWEITP